MTLNTFAKQWWLVNPWDRPVHPGSGGGSGGGRACLGCHVFLFPPITLLLGATSLLYLPPCVLQMFKGPDKDIEFIYTAPSSAVCGVSLDVGGKKEYLIAGVWEFTLPH